MSDDVVIKVESLGKKYRIRHQEQERYTTLRDVLARKLFAPFRYLLGRNGHNEPPALNRQPPLVSTSSAPADQQIATRNQQSRDTASVEDFWALKDVSFEVKRGEVLGIIGRNGAGKSTLLKILSRITEPTVGEVQIRGRIASLLEVGTGFHPELTGRENIFLNGAILGMGKREIQRKFDEIIAFAEIEKFLDTPVKRYSSGMYVRLAFAVAAHLEPEVLIVDEVLAVGDFEFQKKCLGKMQDIASSSGRTILFVSHSLSAVSNLCNRGLVLVNGRNRHLGQADSAIAFYAGQLVKRLSADYPPEPSRPHITRVSIDSELLAQGKFVLEIAFASPFPLSPPVPGLVISSLVGTPIFGTNPRFHREGYDIRSASRGLVRLDAGLLPIHSGTYRLSVWLGDWQNDYDQRIDAIAFDWKPDCKPATMPPADRIGYLDWPVRWVFRGGL